jgi:hypothetical protein
VAVVVLRSTMGETVGSLVQKRFVYGGFLFALLCFACCLLFSRLSASDFAWSNASTSEANGAFVGYSSRIQDGMILAFLGFDCAVVLVLRLEFRKFRVGVSRHPSMRIEQAAQRTCSDRTLVIISSLVYAYIIITRRLLSMCEVLSVSQSLLVSRVEISL